MTDPSDPRRRSERSLALGDWIRELVPAAQPERDALNRALAAKFEPAESGSARVVSLRRGTATIEVGSSCLLHELRTLRYEEILKSFQEAVDAITVRRIAFRLASSTESR